jgi:hypothetical protein
LLTIASATKIAASASPGRSVEVRPQRFHQGDRPLDEVEPKLARRLARGPDGLLGGQVAGTVERRHVAHVGSELPQ